MGGGFLATLDIRPLPREQDQELAALIGLAFHDYPPFRHIHQHLSGNAYCEALTRDFAYYMALIRVVDDPVLGAWEDDRLVGGVLINTPDAPEWTDAQEACTADFGRSLNPDSFARLLAFEELIDENAPELGFPYFYIDTIAVHPDSQGRGYAREMIGHVADLSHRHPTSGAVCLGTEDETNHSLYVRLGFEIVSHVKLDTISSTSFKLVHSNQEPSVNV